MDDLPAPQNAGDETDAPDPRYVVPGLSRGLAMLQIFTRQAPALTLVELAAGLDLSRSAAYRLAYTLEKDGFIARDPASRRYRLTSKVLSLGFEYFSSQSITDQAQPYLRELSETVSASSYLVILDGCHAVYLAKGAPAAGMVSNLQVGSRQAAHLTASGRILLGNLPDDRLKTVAAQISRDYRNTAIPPFAELARLVRQDAARGYVFHPSVLSPGVSSCAAPIRDASRNAVAAITVIGPSPHLELFGGEPALSAAVLAATAQLSRQLGFPG
jgi:IclR family pca regulon transcriptional regulator